MPSFSKWFNGIPGALLAPAAMVAFVTYRAAMNPPRGFWKEDKDGHAAGEPVMLTMFPASYAWFTLLNAMSFGTSLILIVLIVSQRFRGTRTAATKITITVAICGMLCFISAFVFATYPEDPVRGLAPLLLGVVICALVYSVCELVYAS